jgi:hypothetical protein
MNMGSGPFLEAYQRTVEAAEGFDDSEITSIVASPQGPLT